MSQAAVDGVQDLVLQSEGGNVLIRGEAATTAPLMMQETTSTGVSFENTGNGAVTVTLDADRANSRNALGRVRGRRDGAHVADWMSDTIDQVGGDGFLLSIVYAPGSVEEFCEFVIPELQQRGRVRTEYLNGTLRDNLLAF